MTASPEIGAHPRVDEVVEHPVVARLAAEGSLRSKVHRGLLWTAASRACLQVVQLGSQVVLARLLLPEDYGLVALALVVNGLAGLLTELGLAAAVVQARRVTDRLLATAFWVNALSGLLVTGVICAVAPLVAAFYGDPRITQLLQVSSLAFAVNLAAVPSALLQRAMQFRKIGSVEVSAAVAGAGATVLLAATGFGATSLVLGPLVTTALTTVMVWRAVRWWPHERPGVAELRQLWRFGGGLTGANFLNFVSRNADTVLLGRAVSSDQLGLYSRAYSLMMLPLAQVSGVVTRVLLPAFAEVQHDLPRMRRAWLQTVRASLLLGLPVGIGCASASPALVGTLFGDQWMGMVPVLALLAASVPPQLLGRNLGPVFQALGRTGLQFRLAGWSTALTLVAIAAGLPWGITGVALALLIKSWSALAIPLVPLMRLIGMPGRELWRASRGALVAAAALGAASWGTALALTESPPALVLLAQLSAGATAYALCLCLVERAAVVAALRTVKKKVSKR